jgi:hypothetical protein
LQLSEHQLGQVFSQRPHQRLHLRQSRNQHLRQSRNLRPHLSRNQHQRPRR